MAQNPCFEISLWSKWDYRIHRNLLKYASVPSVQHEHEKAPRSAVEGLNMSSVVLFLFLLAVQLFRLVKMEILTNYDH